MQLHTVKKKSILYRNAVLSMMTTHIESATAFGDFSRMHYRKWCGVGEAVYHYRLGSHHEIMWHTGPNNTRLILAPLSKAESLLQEGKKHRIWTKISCLWGQEINSHNICKAWVSKYQDLVSLLMQLNLLHQGDRVLPPPPPPICNHLPIV